MTSVSIYDLENDGGPWRNLSEDQRAALMDKARIFGQIEDIKAYRLDQDYYKVVEGHIAVSLMHWLGYPRAKIQVVPRPIPTKPTFTMRSFTIQ